MATVAGRASVVRTGRVMGSGGVVIFADKAVEMANTNQFLNFILEGFTFHCGVVVVSVVVAIFSHVRVRRSGHLAWQ